MKDYSKLSDEELVDEVAVNVMKWKKDNDFDDAALDYWTDGHISHGNVGVWNPLKDWNDTWKVVEKYIERQPNNDFHFESVHGSWDIFSCNKDEVVAHGEDPQRVICIAALKV